MKKYFLYSLEGAAILVGISEIKKDKRFLIIKPGRSKTNINPIKITFSNFIRVVTRYEYWDSSQIFIYRPNKNGNGFIEFKYVQKDDANLPDRDLMKKYEFEIKTSITIFDCDDWYKNSILEFKDDKSAELYCEAKK